IELFMMKRLLAAFCFAFLAAPAQAHHSGAMFDSGKTVTLGGTVMNFEWTNPHAWIEIMAMDAAGQPERWRIECPAVNIIARKGWRKESLSPGDQVTLTILPMRD